MKNILTVLHLVICSDRSPKRLLYKATSSNVKSETLYLAVNINIRLWRA